MEYDKRDIRYICMHKLWHRLHGTINSHGFEWQYIWPDIDGMDWLPKHLYLDRYRSRWNGYLC